MSWKDTLIDQLHTRTLTPHDLARLSHEQWVTPLQAGMTALHIACQQGDPVRVQWVLNALGEDAPDVAARPDQRGWTPLH